MEKLARRRRRRRHLDTQNVTLTVLVFGPELVSYERSRRETGARINHFSARVFFVKIPQSQYSMIYTILRFFRIHIPKMDSFPMLFSHPTRPPACPPARHGSQVIKMTGFLVFPGSQLNQNEWFSSISRIKTEST